MHHGRQGIYRTVVCIGEPLHCQVTRADPVALMLSNGFEAHALEVHENSQDNLDR